MLEILRIRNLAVIQDLTWELGDGFNILTGETGAGKSILIDAFNLLLGVRADKKLIRDGANDCSIEAVINNAMVGKRGQELSKIFEEFGIESDMDGSLLLKRSFSLKGQSRQFVNGSPTTLQALRKIGDLMVDMHGPHDHQSLLSTESQLAALDAFGKLDDKVAAFREKFTEWRKASRELAELTQTEAGNWEEQIDFLDHQIKEIEEAELTEEDGDALEQEYQVATHSRRIMEMAGSAEELLSNDSTNDVLSQLAEVQRYLQDWGQIDPSAEHLAELNETAIAQLNDLRAEVESAAARTEIDGERLAELEDRLNLVQDLKRKYGGSIASTLEKLTEMQERRAGMADREGRIEELKQGIETLGEDLDGVADELAEARRRVAPSLAEEITAQLKFLGFNQSEFSIELNERDDLKSDGGDDIEFNFAPNPGQAARPLRAIASSGEMARVMLAVKTVLAREDAVPILIFDEVDANVGGETAKAVAGRLRELARNHQVLCITHLPQVAAAGHAHFRVLKEVVEGQTTTGLKQLDDSGRIEELSRMLGGVSNSSAALAQSLMQELADSERPHGSITST